VADGARTGLASVVTGALFLVALFFTPLFEIVPYEAASPALDLSLARFLDEFLWYSTALATERQKGIPR